MLTKEELPECPVATTVSLIGSKWKLLVNWKIKFQSIHPKTGTLYCKIYPRS